MYLREVHSQFASSSLNLHAEDEQITPPRLLRLGN